MDVAMNAQKKKGKVFLFFFIKTTVSTSAESKPCRAFSLANA